MGSFRASSVPFLLFAAGTALQAQQTVHAPAGTLTGLVRDSATGAPVGYALVVAVERDQRVFASEAGRFALTELKPGGLTLRVQQIGYRAVTLKLLVETAGPATAGSAGLVVALARQALVLPEIVVEGSVCGGMGEASGNVEMGNVLDEAFRNAERILTLEKSYPFRGTFQRVTTLLDETYLRTGGWVDTVHFDSRRFQGYREGGVIQKRRGAGGADYANYFTTSDLARPEFRRSHCFWYAGRDSLDGFPAYKIQFSPAPKIKDPDWAGILLIDSATMVLLRSEATLVNLPEKGTTFRSAQCTVLYRPFAPTLVSEFQARCASAQNMEPVRYVVERWLLVDFRFLGKTPTGPP